jgi:hypothetical protein
MTSIPKVERKRRPFPQKIERTLLGDLEATGRSLDKISLVDLCDENEFIYGSPGKSRRPVQARFGKIKKLTPRGYRRLLAKHNINAGPATLAAQAQAPSEDEESDDEEEEVLSDDEDVLSDDVFLYVQKNGYKEDTRGDI